MKFQLVFFVLLGLILPAAGQEKGRAENAEKKPTKWEVKIPEPISDGTPSETVAKPAPINFKVIRSRTKKVDVVEAPEMLGLPPITGRISFTVRTVEDPGFPDPPELIELLPALEPDDPAVVAKMEELRERYHGTSLIFMSASVYDHKRTLLRIHTNGDDGSEVVAWSNLDLNHFSDFSTYRVKDAVDGTLYDYGILMGIGNEDTVAMSEIDSRRDIQYESPRIPELPDVEKGGPAFVVMEGKAASSAMATLEQIHDLYRKEGPRMEAAFHAREKAYAERRAYLLANPTKPKDVTISFVRRDYDPEPALTTDKKEVAR